MILTRQEFTMKLAKLLNEMIASGDYPVIDYVMRSSEEQFRLFQKGRAIIDGNFQIVDKSKIVTNCDGRKILSAHNKGMAADIYFSDGDNKIFFEINDNIKEKYIKWHKRWEELGGRSLIEWDLPHFE